jgi:CheY-like chemotaxis protein
VARILIVDGDPGSRQPLERALAEEGLDVLCAADAGGAWDAFAVHAPQVAVLGRLPHAAAEELLARMRTADPDVIVLAPQEPFPDFARRLRIRLAAPVPRERRDSAPRGGPGTSRVLARPPLATGELSFGALVDVLVPLWRSAADGIVAIEHAAGAERILLRRGAPVDVHLSGGEGGADVAARLASLCAAASGTWRFHPGSEFAHEAGAAPVPALAPLLAGLRIAADEDSYADALAALGDAAPVLVLPGVILRELQPDPDDLAVLSALDGGRTVADLLRRPGLPASLLWFLARAGAVDLGAPASATRVEPGPRPSA